MIKTVQARMICNRIKEDADFVNQLKDSYIELENKFHEVDKKLKEQKKLLSEIADFKLEHNIPDDVKFIIMLNPLYVDYYKKIGIEAKGLFDETGKPRI